MSEWKDISTAPKGVRVLLARPEYANTPNSPMELLVAAKIDGAHGPGWCTPDGYEIFRATHWMPLPAPPATNAADNGQPPQDDGATADPVSNTSQESTT